MLNKIMLMIGAENCCMICSLVTWPRLFCAKRKQ